MIESWLSPCVLPFPALRVHGQYWASPLHTAESQHSLLQTPSGYDHPWATDLAALLSVVDL
jgi:hypothetical protein